MLLQRSWSCIYCVVAKSNGRGNICSNCEFKHCEAQTKLCTTCSTIRKWEEFSKKKGRLFGLQTKCKLCTSRYGYERNRKKEHFLLKVLKRNIENNRRRNKTGSRNLGFDDTYEDMCSKLIELGDRCAYSGLPMTFKPNSDWQCSPERIDNSIGYIKSNRTFICLEFQTAQVQGSKKLVEFLCMVETKSHPRLAEIVSNQFVETAWIPHCDTMKTNCKECKNSYNRWYSNTVNGRIRRLAACAKKSTTQRNSNGRNHEPSDADYDNILKMLQDQQGKCLYSGHHLGFESGKWNCMSLERFNVNLGYSQKHSNYGLIMSCLNTSDYSSRKSIAEIPKDGSGAWSKAKIEYLRAFANRNGNENET